MKRYNSIALLTCVIIIIVAFIVVFVGQGGNTSNTTPSPDPMIGSESEPFVVIQEYSDFQCPACQSTGPIIQSLIEDYPDLIRVYYNDFPLSQHTYAADAAVGAECAFQLGAFWEYHDLVYEKQEEWSSASDRTNAQELLRSYAQEIGVKMDVFEQCVSDPATAERVNEDIAEGKALGVTETPTFFVNGELISEAPLAAALRRAIDLALNEKGIPIPQNQ